MIAFVIFYNDSIRLPYYNRVRLKSALVIPGILRRNIMDKTYTVEIPNIGKIAAEYETFNEMRHLLF